MADKNIGSLPAASTVDDDSLLVAEQQGQAVKVTGAQFKGFAQQAVQQYVEQAQEAASDALEASEQALKAVAGIGTAVEDTKANKQPQSRRRPGPKLPPRVRRKRSKKSSRGL